MKNANKQKNKKTKKQKNKKNKKQYKIKNKGRMDSTFSSWIYPCFLFFKCKIIIIKDYYFNYSIHIIYKFFLINE